VGRRLVLLLQRLGELSRRGLLPVLLGCPDCCFSADSTDYPDPCVYADGHQVVVYRTTDFLAWENLGVALPAANRKAGSCSGRAWSAARLRARS